MQNFLFHVAEIAASPHFPSQAVAEQVAAEYARKLLEKLWGWSTLHPVSADGSDNFLKMQEMLLEKDFSVLSDAKDAVSGSRHARTTGVGGKICLRYLLGECANSKCLREHPSNCPFCDAQPCPGAPNYLQYHLEKLGKPRQIVESSKVRSWTSAKGSGKQHTWSHSENQGRRDTAQREPRRRSRSREADRRVKEEDGGNRH